MKLYCYVVARDFGFAPNPFYGICTLATCKPTIRRTAQVGDWVIGTGSKNYGLQGRLVFAMRVTEVLTFDQYWSDPRFQAKRPTLTGSIKQAFGDNIYHRDPATQQWQQANSHHSLKDGCPNPANIHNDTKTDRVLLSTEFTYWGGSGPEIPPHLRDYTGQDICTSTQGHKSRFDPRLVNAFIAWLNSLSDNGYVGSPSQWSRAHKWS